MNKFVYLIGNKVIRVKAKSEEIARDFVIKTTKMKEEPCLVTTEGE